MVNASCLLKDMSYVRYPQTANIWKGLTMDTPPWCYASAASLRPCSCRRPARAKVAKDEKVKFAFEEVDDPSRRGFGEPATLKPNCSPLGG